MTRFAHTVEIARPVEEVFAFLSEPESDEGPVPFRGTFELEPALAGPLAARMTLDELARNTLRLKHLLEENRPR